MTRSQESRLREHLWAKMQALPAPAFEHLVALLMVRLDYQNVEVLRGLGPRGASRKGRTGHGGADLRASTQLGLSRSIILAQVKQYDRPVSRRFVDELRGALLRAGAHSGLLVATSTFSPAAYRAAQDASLVPVRLVGGLELVELLCAHRLGVRQKRSGPWALDREFFRRLHLDSGEANRDKAASARPRSDGKRSGRPPEMPPTQSTNGQPPSSGATERKPNLQKGGGMTWRTHALFGVGALWILQPLPGVLTADTLAPLAAFSLLGALLPDLDAAESKIKHLRVGGVKPFRLASEAIHGSFGHRGLLHSLLGLGNAALLVALLTAWWNWIPALGITLGYASHLAADACTKSGIPLLFPSRRRCHLLPRRLRFTTGSAAEDALFVAMAFVAAALILLHWPFALSSPYA